MKDSVVRNVLWEWEKSRSCLGAAPLYKARRDNVRQELRIASPLGPLVRELSLGAGTQVVDGRKVPIPRPPASYYRQTGTTNMKSEPFERSGPLQASVWGTALWRRVFQDDYRIEKAALSETSSPDYSKIAT
jgi:hypothetical protein